MSKEEIGMYELAYANVAHYLQNEMDAKKQKTKILKNTAIDIMLSNIGIENSQIYFVDPLKVEIEDSIAYWGMLSFTPNYKNIFGTVFYHPREAETEIEILCGLYWGYEQMRLTFMYDIETKSGTEPCLWTRSLDFTQDGIEGIFEQLDDLNLDKIFETLPDVINLTSGFLEVVNWEIIGYSAKDIPT